MKWFKHDTRAHRDAKIKKLKRQYGITGYGLYLYCLELIAGEVDGKNITFELEDDVEEIAAEWKLDRLLVQEIMLFMVSLELFENRDGIITCLKLATRLDEATSKNPEIRKAVKLMREQGLIDGRAANTPKISEPVQSISDNNQDELRNNSGTTPEHVRSDSGELPESVGTSSEQTRLDKIRLDKIRSEQINNTPAPAGLGGVGGDQSDDVILSLPAKGGASHEINRQTFERYRENFPTVDVLAQLKALCNYLEDNPHKRVPHWNTKNQISSWLNNRVGDNAAKAKAAINTRGDFTAERYTIDDTAKQFEVVGGKS